MRFATARQIVALTLLWTATLYAVDYARRPRTLASVLAGAEPALTRQPLGPRVTLSFQHLCCTGCLSDLRSALGGFAWVGAIRLNARGVPTRAEADAAQVRPGSIANQLEIDVARIESVDFIEMESALRRAGFAVGRMEISGVAHYRLEADLPHLCCRLCSLAANQQGEMVKTLRSGGQFRWLDSITIVQPKKKLIAYARYGQTANVSELENALESMGFAPSAIRLSVEREQGRL